MCLIDIVTTYLYGKLDNDIYMRVLEGLKILKMGIHQTRNMYSIRLQRFLLDCSKLGVCGAID